MELKVEDTLSGVLNVYISKQPKKSESEVPLLQHFVKFLDYVFLESLHYTITDNKKRIFWSIFLKYG